MKSSFVYLFALICSSTAFAIMSDADIRNYVANDIDALLGDTVNEGEGSAYVAHCPDGQPNVQCVESGNQLTREVLFDVKVWSEGESSVRGCELIYIIDGDKLISDENAEQACIETLSEGD